MKVISEEGGVPNTRAEGGVFYLTDSFRWSNIHATEEKHHPERLDF